MCVCVGGVIVLKLVAKVKEDRGGGWRRGGGGEEGGEEGGRPAGWWSSDRQAGGQTDGQDLCLSMCNTNVALDEMDSGPFFAATQRKKKYFFQSSRSPLCRWQAAA